MRVMVTGGAGYIGSVVTEELLRAGHEVVVYDNLSAGFRDAVTPPATLVEADLLDAAALGRALREHATEAVVHMAGLIAVGESMIRPELYYRVNVQGGLGLLDAMIDAGVRRLVFSSTAAVYGDPERVPLDEEAPLRATNAYGDTKLTFERAIAWYARAHGLGAVSLRYFNAAGASARNGERHVPETHLIPNVLRAARGELPEVVLFGSDYPTRDGTCVRDYVHVVDLAAAHVLALETLRGEPSGANTPFNVGCGGDGYTVREVVEAASKVTGREIPTRSAPRRPGDPAVLVASSERIRQTLGWKPAQQDLESIVASAWRWMRARAG
jgi:UDP-glucose 4-epimerase